MARGLLESSPESRKDYLPGVAGSKKHEKKSAKELGIEELKNFDPKKTSTPDVRAALHSMQILEAETGQIKLAEARKKIQLAEGTAPHEKTDENDLEELSEADLEELN